MSEALVLQGQIESVLALDDRVQSGQETELVEISQVVWHRVRSGKKQIFLAEAAMIHSFRHARLPGGTEKWRRVRLTDAHISSTWSEFCLAHLEMDGSTASNYWKLWELYVQRLGFPVPDLLVAGVSKLVAARKTVEATYPVVSERLTDALFGNLHKCRACRAVQDSDALNGPLFCGDCSAAFVPVPPASYVETLVVLREIRDARQMLQDGLASEPRVRLVADLEVDDDRTFIRVIPTLKIGDESYPFPVWEVPVIGDDVIGEGIPAGQYDRAERVLRRVFR